MTYVTPTLPTDNASGSPDPSSLAPHPFFQSVHFANGNPANSMKTGRPENFNRYTFRPSRVCRPPSLSLVNLAAVAALWHPDASGPTMAPGLEIDAND
jgi:hypothetical protein